MTYTEALDYIHNINWQFCNPGLDRTRTLCEKLGNPEKKLRFVHVAGTNGKGSFCAMLSSILSAAGYRTGLYTSPFIRRFNERMQINGTPISDDELAEITESVKPIADSMEERPTEFELVTAIAFEYFARHQCDVVVLEVGLGGRLDSTNVIDSPLLSVITGIDFDHTALLGNTIGEIAREKAGIIKRGCPCLYGSDDPIAMRTVRAVANAKSAPFRKVDRSKLRVTYLSLDGTVFDCENYINLKLSLAGTYQPLNAVTVLTAVRILSEERGLAIPEDAVRKGLACVKWPARFEVLNREIPVLYDGGHNPQGITAAVESINLYFVGHRVNLLTGVMKDKGYDEMIEKLKPIAEHVFTVCPGGARALPAQDYAKSFLEHGVSATAYETVEAGVRAAVEDSRRKRIPLVCLGSLYLYSSATEALEKVLAE